VWPWTLYLLRIIDDAYADFEARVVAARALTGRTKREQVRQYVLEQARPEFRFVDIVAALPDISPATIREALNELAREGKVDSGRGRGFESPRSPSAKYLLTRCPPDRRASISEGGRPPA